MLLYPVYALLFNDTGLTVWQISSLFVIWAVSSMALDGSYAVLADIGGHGGAFAMLALPYVAISLWLFATRRLTSSVVQGGGSGPESKEEHDAPSSG